MFVAGKRAKKRNGNRCIRLRRAGDPCIENFRLGSGNIASAQRSVHPTGRNCARLVNFNAKPHTCIGSLTGSQSSNGQRIQCSDIPMVVSDFIISKQEKQW
ncbi:hypothetical protein F441_15376 [Phytophthora nicotianae CJ01A1]|uniref:Uncharacterized protein n=5 Tax=Phytophthora nicotianae TaxID=4792 RepID=V9EJV3_PHYNI|nr:hypothetical protein F443_15552 [Phytophthora nicotianae P1569]ETK78994.1 hypothetical protein L915_15108 [Phytophthora nicotianae]ETO67547.1 hypothetical protein F444_15545 [Phytophthora nicotianae P1976]ETP08702.1 hypothetical protein F441_15376 [Phytophthora nicotianae CJ01A1]ETP36734.1 hypothetical protein F442_15390 [Phytophthora nicotianae P10297]